MTDYKLPATIRFKMSQAKLGRPSNTLGKTWKLQPDAKNCQHGENHPSWKGSNVGYNYLHKWLRRNFGSADHCEVTNCTGKSKLFEWANLSGQYLRERNDYRQLCRSCHRTYDNARRRAQC